MRMRRLFALGIATLFASCTTPGPPPPSAASLPRFIDEFFFAWVQRDPEWFSELRAFGDDVDPYGDLLSDVSLAAQQDNLRFARSALTRLRRYDLSEADGDTRVSAEALAWYLDDYVRGEPFLLSDYPVNQYDGEQLRLIAFMTDVHVIRSPLDAENYVVRLSKFGVRVEQLLEGLRAREVRGVIPPRPILAKVVAGLREFLAQPPAENPLVATFRARLAAVEGLESAEAEGLVAAAAEQVAETVYPAYHELSRYVEGLMSGAPEQAGVWRLPNGEAYYAHLVRHHTTLDIQPSEIHELGLREVERLQTQLRGVFAALGFEAESFGDVVRAYWDSFPESEPHYHPADTAGRERALAAYRALTDDARRHFADRFATMPQVPVAVEPFPPWQQEGATAATYVPPSLDGRRPGVFYVNLGRPVFRPRMQTLVYHEAIPGHHVQLGLQREAQRLPTFSRVVSFTAFSEGWAFYAERLALEQGLYEDAHSAISNLWYELLRSARLVVDTGLHHERWWRRDAMEWMRENLGDEQEAQVDRYIVRPAEALAYKIGEIRLLELRRRAQQELGARFEIVRFHDAMLSRGSLPLAVLERALERFIEAERSRSSDYSRSAKATSASPMVVPARPWPPAAITTNCRPPSRTR